MTSRLESLSAPIARIEPETREIHGETLIDPYRWLQQRDAPAVVAHLEAENAFTAASMGHTEALRERLFGEIVGRMRETDSSVPVRIDDYWYYTRTEAGKQYPIRCRKHGSLESAEEILLDINPLAGDGGFLDLGAFSVSPDHRRLAYSLNEDGSESFTLRVIDLEQRKMVGEAIPDTSPSVVWANDNATLFYVVRDDAYRPYQVFRHRVGQPQSTDELVFQEDDERFFVSVFKTRSQRFLGIRSESTVTTELQVMAADDPAAEPRRLLERQQGVELDLDHHGEDFYVLTSEQALNFKLMRVPIDDFAVEAWQEVLPHREQVVLEEVHCFQHHLVIQLRREGLRRLLVRDLRSAAQHEVSFDEPAYSVSVGDNPEYATEVLRLAYTSLVTPQSIVDYDMETRQRELRKRTEVLGGYDSERFVAERIEARATDGTLIPVSLVYARNLPRDGSNPTLLSAYGAYGACNEPRFVASRLSLLERGFVVAIAHVRGGGELGRGWYEAGKLLSKQNTFSDFIAVAEHLVAEGYTEPSRLAIRGGSAGGLLIGAVLNQRPDLFAAALADVPFVDTLNTMLDPTVPLTVTEFEEWGDPRERPFYDVIRAYSPYDNLTTQPFPHLLVTAGLNDPRVQYWEPAKWVARLRDLKKGRQRLLLKVEMGSGHGGASGRYDALRQEAFKLAFFLDSLDSPRSA
ncbi:MAG: S9 family peptidase [Acidobacteriota bacterium]